MIFFLLKLTSSHESHPAAPKGFILKLWLNLYGKLRISFKTELMHTGGQRPRTRRMTRINGRKMKATYSDTICNLTPRFCFFIAKGVTEVQPGFLVDGATLLGSQLPEGLVSTCCVNCHCHFLTVHFPFFPVYFCAGSWGWVGFKPAALTNID